MFASFVEGFYAAPLADISIRSVADDASGAGGDDAAQSHVRGGYGRLVQWLGARLEHLHVRIRRRCEVQGIDWRESPVRLAIRDDRVETIALAPRVIVTLPVGVLGSFDVWPELGDHARALRDLAMGQVVKLVVRMRVPVFRAQAKHHMDFVHAADGAFPTYWLRSAGDEQQLTAWAGGPHAMALRQVSVDGLVDRALTGFAAAVRMPRAEVIGAVHDYHFHDYDADPRARGAYSYTRVGGTGAADLLARPLGERLYFAGEATSAAYEGTVAGALESGGRAARQVLAELGARRAGFGHQTSGFGHKIRT
jgi:monoamine oxidase